MTGRRYDVVVAGIQCIDLVLNPVADGVMGRDLTLADSAKLMLGGDALNEAIVLSTLGARTGLMGLVGNDRLGNVLLEQLSEYPMTVLDRRADVNTAISVVPVGEDGERHFVYQPESNNALSRAHLDDDAIRNAAFLSVAGCLLMPSLDGEGLCDALDLARSAGTRTALDFCVGSPVSDKAMLRELLRRADYILPSEWEAECMVGSGLAPAETASTRPISTATIWLCCCWKRWSRMQRRVSKWLM